MAPTRELSTEERAQIVAFSESGMRQIDIANRLMVSQSVVAKTLRKYRERGTFSSAKRQGRPRATTHRTDVMIRRVATIHPMWSAKEIAAELPAATSTRTIQRRLHDEFDLKSRRPAKKPLLSRKNLRDRLAFCRKYRHWTAQMWKSVLFTDESQFHLFENMCKYVRRPRNARFNRRYTLPTVRHSPSVMVWGSFSGRGIGSLHFLPPNTTFRAANYLAMLQEVLPHTMERLGATVLQQDNAPCHKAKIVGAWLRSENIEVLEWAGQSPDLNPIENLWYSMKRKVKLHQPTGLPHLRAIITQVWNEELSPSACEKLAESMPRRIQAVLKNKGGHSSY